MDPEEGPARRNLEMSAMSTNTTMNEWTRSGWVITPAHGLGIIDVPPPRAANEFAAELVPPQVNVGAMLQVLEPEEYFEFVEDLLIAQETEREYDTRGVEGTISYTDYRNRRLGSKP